MNILIIHFRSVIFTILVLIILLLFANNILDISEKSGLFVVVILLVIIFYATHKIGRRFIFTIIPIGIIISSLALLYFIDSTFKRSLFAISVGIIYYSAFLGIVRMKNNSRDITARTFFSISIISTIFFFFAAFYGVYINFEIPLWFFLSISSIFLFFITFTSLRIYSKNAYRAFLGSAIISFLIVQIMWMMNFWPFGYLTNASVIVLFYYIIWDMFIMVFTITLSKKRVISNIMIGLCLLSILLFTSRWVLM